MEAGPGQQVFAHRLPRRAMGLSGTGARLRETKTPRTEVVLLRKMGVILGARRTPPYPADIAVNSPDLSGGKRSLPHRLQLPVSQRPPDPLERSELEVLQPQRRSNQLHHPDPQHHLELT